MKTCSDAHFVSSSWNLGARTVRLSAGACGGPRANTVYPAQPRSGLLTTIHFLLILDPQDYASRPRWLIASQGVPALGALMTRPKGRKRQRLSIHFGPWCDRHMGRCSAKERGARWKSPVCSMQRPIVPPDQSSCYVGNDANRSTKPADRLH